MLIFFEEKGLLVNVKSKYLFLDINFLFVKTELGNLVDVA